MGILGKLLSYNFVVYQCFLWLSYVISLFNLKNLNFK
jgi:hypothetical protein